MPDINGWVPPVIYDINTDQTRIATQEDIDRMQWAVGQFMNLRSLLKGWEAGNVTGFQNT